MLSEYLIRCLLELITGSAFSLVEKLNKQKISGLN